MEAQTKLLKFQERSDPGAELYRVVRVTCAQHMARQHDFFFLIRSQAVEFNQINFNKQKIEQNSGIEIRS